ncbi:ABC transporter, ATP-binding protein [Deferribacter desulfuricans SSM1]|uniref:ABC transporter, ATP-binding protein n=1 Tax=Deferribacter desulfuricans (strain DSM 14783 / JCM 11476 / NBRC 101012 / SSM1) TaxID=639282 RepID=D3PDB6_DEFDS|nr:ABC transporter ATP-binding protein [Deferribacter desulfuricans]BAI80589.1 ABC transporter, ATP-binding protein [Deferribacter desulfuricans SSM1]
MEIAIEVIDLHKSFGEYKVHKGINLKIVKNAITYIIGPSGTGKSVLLKQIMGLLKPDKGKVIVLGEDLSTLNKKELLNIRKKFGMLFQNAALFDSMNVYENVAFPLREHTKLREKEIRKIVLEKLRLVGLTNVEYKMPSELSGGMRKRVGLARAIALEPEIILYDEPTTGLDPIMTDVVDNLIYETQKKLNITSIVISHDIESTFKIADYIAMIYDGKIVMYGTPEEFKKTDNPYVRQFLSGSKDGPIKIG